MKPTAKQTGYCLLFGMVVLLTLFYLSILFGKDLMTKLNLIDDPKEREVYEGYTNIHPGDTILISEIDSSLVLKFNNAKFEYYCDNMDSIRITYNYELDSICIYNEKEK